MNLSGYPVVYINSIDDRIIEYDWLSIEVSPPLFPGMELSITDMRWVVKRVFVDQPQQGMPVLWVLVSPSNDEPFVLDTHIDSLKEIYEFQANRVLGENDTDEGFYGSYELN